MAEYTWREELAWAAGFFDGEGCFSNIYRTTGVYAGASIGQTNKEPLVRFQRAVGLGYINGPYCRRTGSLGRKPVFRWAVTGFPGTQAVAALLWNFLSSPKREQYQLTRSRMSSTRVTERGFAKTRKLWTHCSHGHEFTEENTRIDSIGHRTCRTCHRINEAAYRKRRASRGV